MYLPDSQLTASQILKTFHQDELYLFLGAAFTTVGLTSIFLAFVTRKFEILLLWLAMFAILYGQRLWLQSGLLHLLLPQSPFFDRLRDASNFLVPIPAFLFFEAAGFLRFWNRRVVPVLAVVFLGLFAASLMIPPSAVMRTVNGLVVVACLITILIQVSSKRVTDPDSRLMRNGLYAFVVASLFDDTVGAVERLPRIEPIGFAIFLMTLGYITVLRTIRRDQQFGEVQKELEVARQIQTSILPSAFPASANFELAVRYVPMTKVAGDFYDYLVAESNRVGILIADVTGHGIPAALIASMVKVAASAQLDHVDDPASFLSGMNTTLCGNTQGQYVTAAYAYLESDTALLRYSAAGHPPLLLVRSGEVLEIEQNGLLLGAFRVAMYSATELTLEPGDRIVMYTDGILEAERSDGEQFGQERLQSLLRTTCEASAESAADAIANALASWSSMQFDDITVLICDYRRQA